jgi:hypothetical protein
MIIGSGLGHYSLNLGEKIVQVWIILQDVLPLRQFPR